MNLILTSTKQTNILLEFSLIATNGLKEPERSQNIKQEMKHFQEAWLDTEHLKEKFYCQQINPQASSHHPAPLQS